MSRIVTFGEIMLRLQPPSYQRVAQARNFEACFGGSEANTAAALAQWGGNAAFVTKLPANALGDSCVRALRAQGVDTSRIVRGGGRMGIYFTEKGASQRPPQVVYDRAYSAFALAVQEDFDFDAALGGADWFHFSGITPALGGGLPAVTKTAAEAARSAGAKISCDLNYRSKLWGAEEARRVMPGLIGGIDVLILNESQAQRVFGIGGKTDEEIAEAVAAAFHVRTVALTRRRTVSGEVNEFSATLVSDGRSAASRTYSIFMIDKIGGGDAFSAGLIHGLLAGWDEQHTVDFAAAAACYKHTVEGDMLVAGVEDIEWVMKSDGSGRMVR